MPLIQNNRPVSKLVFNSVFVALLVGQCFSQVHACSSSADCEIKVLFTGEYTDETCNVIINNASNNETITLPKVSIATLQMNAAEAGSRPFDITLKDCPASRKIAVTFKSNVSPADTTTGNLLNDTGSVFSNNVQIRLRKEDSSQVVIDNDATGQEYIISSAGDPLTHRFTASYYAKGNSAVTAGKVHAAAGVVLVYK